MRKANISEVPSETWKSPTGKFNSWGKGLTAAIGADSRSTDLVKRWPFDLELSGIPAGATNCPYHSHSNQYELYVVLSGALTVRHKDGETLVTAGDFFMFAPGEPHQMINRGTEEATYYCIADNPLNEHCYYPDSDKYALGLPDARALIKNGGQVGYFHGEDHPPTGVDQRITDFVRQPFCAPPGRHSFSSTNRRKISSSEPVAWPDRVRSSLMVPSASSRP